MPIDPQAGTAAPAHAARATPLFRFDPGWPFVVAGLGLLVAGVLIPAQRELHDLENTRAVHAAIEDRSVRQLAAYDRFLNDLDRSDDQLVRRLAASQLNQMPDGERSLMLVPSMNDTVTEWIEGSEPLQLPETAEYPDTLLTRLATGPRRLWVLACGAFLVFIGLLLGPNSLLTRPRIRKDAACSQDGGVAVAETAARHAPAEPTADDMMAARAAIVAVATASPSADDSSDEHAACEPSASALAAIESGATEVASAAAVTESIAVVHAAHEATEASNAIVVPGIESQASVDSDTVAMESPILADSASFEHLAEACDVVDAHVAVTTVESIDAEPSAEAACMAVYAEAADSAEPAVADAAEIAAEPPATHIAEVDDDGAESVASDEVSGAVDEATVEAEIEIEAEIEAEAEADALETDSSDDDATEDEDESSPSSDDDNDEVEVAAEVGNGTDAAGTQNAAGSVGEYLFEPSDEYLHTDGGEDIASANTELAPRKRKKKSILSESIDDAYASMTLFDGITDDRWVDTRDPRASTLGDDPAE